MPEHKLLINKSNYKNSINNKYPQFFIVYCVVIFNKILMYFDENNFALFVIL